MIRLTTLRALPLLLTMATPCLAADPSAPTAETCRNILSHSGQLTAETAEPVGADGCAFGKMRVTLSPSQTWSVERLVLTRLDFARLAGGPQIPLTLRAVATGIRFSPTTPSAVTNYVLRVTIRPFDVTLDYDGGAGNGPFKLAEFSMRGRNVGEVRLSAELANVAAAAIEAPDTALDSGAALKTLRFHLFNQGFVESYLVAPLAGAWLQDSTDPDATVEQAKQTAVATLRGMLGGAGTPTATIEALVAFVLDFPHPDKMLDVAIDAPKPIGVAEFTALEAGKTTLRDLLPPGSLTATYATNPTPP